MVVHSSGAETEWLSQRSQGTRRNYAVFLCVPCDLCERFGLTLVVECTVNHPKCYHPSLPLRPLPSPREEKKGGAAEELGGPTLYLQPELRSAAYAWEVTHWLGT